jgi:hypothetical protein
VPLALQPNRDLRSRAAPRALLKPKRTAPSAPTPVDVVALAPGAPFGGVLLNVDSRTLCHSCVNAWTGALVNPDRARCASLESICVQYKVKRLS